MKTLRLQLQDVRAVTVSGEDYEGVSTFVANQYFGQSLPVKNSDAVYKVTTYTPVVEALPVPGLDFEKTSTVSCESGSGQEPANNFPRSIPNAEQVVLNVPANVEPLLMPAMNFEKQQPKSK